MFILLLLIRLICLIWLLFLDLYNLRYLYLGLRYLIHLYLALNCLSLKLLMQLLAYCSKAQIVIRGDVFSVVKGLAVALAALSVLFCWWPYLGRTLGRYFSLGLNIALLTPWVLGSSSFSAYRAEVVICSWHLACIHRFNKRLLWLIDKPIQSGEFLQVVQEILLINQFAAVAMNFQRRIRFSLRGMVIACPVRSPW